MGFEEVTIGACRLIRADALEVLPTLEPVGAVVTDPPYGMAWDTRTARFSGGNNPSHREPGRHDHRPIIGDDMPFDPAPWLTFAEVILWGSHHYAQRLPVGTTLVWIKRFDHAFGSFLSDAELAWQKGGHGVYCYRDLSMNATVAQRHHPTQKPLPLMCWCVGRLSSTTIIDPYMGSGTTAVACMQLGRSFVGVEIDEHYFDIACRRIEATYAQPDLFIPHPVTPPTQAALW